MNRVKLAREAANVTRFHTQPTLVTETVAHHSFNVVNLLLIMTNCEISKRAIIAALVHDMGEPVVGDIPSPVKRAMDSQTIDNIVKLEMDHIAKIHPYTAGEDYTFTPQEAFLLDLCDKLDGLLKCTEELELGNKKMIPIGNRYVSYIHAQHGDKPMHDITAKIIHQWQTGVIPCQVTTSK